MSKRMKEIDKLVDKNKLYTLDEAIDLLKKLPKLKFDESVEVHIRLGIDPKRTEQTVRGTVVLPHGTGKMRRIAVIARDDKLKEAEESGADFYGSDELIDKISKGWLDFDILITTPDMMKNLAKLGKLLGPKGLMPNPKTGTVTFNIKNIVKESKSGRVEYKNDSNGIIHCLCGKLSFEKNKLIENIKTLIDTVIKSKPASVKGQYIKSIAISTTMGPGIKINYGI